MSRGGGGEDGGCREKRIYIAGGFQERGEDRRKEDTRPICPRNVILARSSSSLGRSRGQVNSEGIFSQPLMKDVVSTERRKWLLLPATNLCPTYVRPRNAYLMLPSLSAAHLRGGKVFRGRSLESIARLFEIAYSMGFFGDLTL